MTTEPKKSPKKSLGQHFLTNPDVVRDMLHEIALTKDDVVVEIGPGPGILTEKLVSAAKKVIAIEIDKSLAEDLENKFSGDTNLTVISGDVLSVNLPELLSEHAPDEKDYSLIANIPYYITAPIIRLFLESPSPPKEMLLMVQKEVGQRLAAEPGSMSLLSVSAQFYADVEYCFTVPAADFHPAPKVDSAVVKLRLHRVRSSDEEIQKFFRVARAGFAAKRKTLINNLANGLHRDKEEIENVLAKQKIAPTARAQELSIAQWQKLSKTLAD